MFKKSLMALAILAAAVSTANASTVFSDDFDSNALGLNATPTGWSVNDGSVDIIGDPIFYDFLPGNGKYIDLDGSTGDAGVLSKTLSLTGGKTYVASFDLAGNQRGGDDTGTVTFGTSTWTYTGLASASPFTLYSLSFLAPITGNYNLSFANAGGDNVGALLDNVKVTATPIPAAIWLFGSALAGLVGVSRRKASALAA